jgi:hypothetical protein
MSDAWLKVHAYRRLRTGSASLLPSLGNPHQPETRYFKSP